MCVCVNVCSYVCVYAWRAPRVPRFTEVSVDITTLHPRGSRGSWGGRGLGGSKRSSLEGISIAALKAWLLTTDTFNSLPNKVGATFSLSATTACTPNSSPALQPLRSLISYAIETPTLLCSRDSPSDDPERVCLQAFIPWNAKFINPVSLTRVRRPSSASASMGKTALLRRLVLGTPICAKTA